MATNSPNTKNKNFNILRYNQNIQIKHLKTIYMYLKIVKYRSTYYISKMAKYIKICKIKLFFFGSIDNNFNL